jgi:hypothetical protein
MVVVERRGSSWYYSRVKPSQVEPSRVRVGTRPGEVSKSGSISESCFSSVLRGVWRWHSWRRVVWLHAWMGTVDGVESSRHCAGAGRNMHHDGYGYGTIRYDMVWYGMVQYTSLRGLMTGLCNGRQLGGL